MAIPAFPPNLPGDAPQTGLIDLESPNFAGSSARSVKTGHILNWLFGKPATILLCITHIAGNDIHVDNRMSTLLGRLDYPGYFCEALPGGGPVGRQGCGRCGIPSKGIREAFLPLEGVRWRFFARTRRKISA